MKICDEKHDEVVFDSRDCPVCQAISDREQLEEELNSTQKELDSARAEINKNSL